MLNLLKRVGTGFSVLICSLVTGLTVLLWLSQLGVFPYGSLFSGLTFIPPFWVLLLFGPLLLILLFSRKGLVLIAGIPLLGYFLVYGDWSSAWLFKQKTVLAAEQNLSVLALNVQYYDRGLDSVIEGIRSLNPDLALLSENVLTDGQLRYFKEKIAPLELRVAQKYGTAIISRYPILEFKEIFLPSRQASLKHFNDLKDLSKNPHRSFAHAVIDVKGTSVHAISIRFIAGRAKSLKMSDRLEWGQYLLGELAKEVDFFTDYLKKLKGPYIFGGDLNAPPSSFVIRRLHSYGTDAYLQHHWFGNFTFRSTEVAPALRLDFMFHSPQLTSLNARIVKMVVSDHFPLLCNFKLVKPSNK